MTTAPRGTSSRWASPSSTGRAVTFSVPPVTVMPIAAIRSATPHPPYAPFSGNVTSVPPVIASGSHEAVSMAGSSSSR